MIFDTILTIIGMACLTNMAHATELYHRVLKWCRLDFKPFSCVMCSTFWYTLVISWHAHNLQAIFIAATAAMLAELINIQIHKL